MAITYNSSIEAFLSALQYEKRYSPNTVSSYQNDLLQFFEFLFILFEGLVNIFTIFGINNQHDSTPLNDFWLAKIGKIYLFLLFNTKFAQNRRMFTGIIEATGIITDITEEGSNRTFWVNSLISNELKVDQSVSHSGVCLTVEEVSDRRHRVTAIAETLAKTTLGDWKAGDLVNLERCMVLNGRLDGHIVQGHIDGTAACVDRRELKGSWEFRIKFQEHFSGLIIEKGSVAVNGISLTAFDVDRDSFSIAIIPYTYNNTSISVVKAGTPLNIEFDIIGKYIQRALLLKSHE